MHYEIWEYNILAKCMLKCYRISECYAAGYKHGEQYPSDLNSSRSMQPPDNSGLDRWQGAVLQIKARQAIAGMENKNGKTCARGVQNTALTPLRSGQLPLLIF